MYNLEGRKVLLTGVTGDIGRDIVGNLVKLGAFVVGTGTNKIILQELQEKYGNSVYMIPCDLSSNLKEVLKMVSDAENIDNKAIDTLIYNAGINIDKLAIRLQEEEWDKVLHVNLTSAFFSCQAVIPSMMRGKFGRIVLISSVVGITGNYGQANYAASKAGMIGMAKTLALEYASRGITVNIVAPGFIETKMTNSISQDKKQEFLQKIPQNRFGQVDDVTNAVMFLISNESKYITGSTINVNGGMYMN